MRLREVVLLAALGCVALSSPAAAPAAGLWHTLGRIDRARPSGLACAGPSLCVAIDATGDALSTSRPLSRRHAWRIAHIDPGTRLWGVSCPSPSLCVAVDDAGRVFTSTHPARGAAFWRSGTIRRGGLFSVSCPSPRLCVAVGGQDVALSTRPRDGARSWRLVRGVDQSLAPECGPGGQASACGTPELLSVSCPSARFCAASDSFGSRIRSMSPGSIRGWPRSGDAAIGLADGPVACINRFRCLTPCAAGAGFFTSQCPGSVPGSGDIETLRTVKIGVSHHAVSADEPVGLWCPAPKTCFAADAPGALQASRDPTNPTSAWTTLITAPQVPDDPQTIVGVACPRLAACLALDSVGVIHAGSPPPTAGQIRAVLRRGLATASLPGRRARTITLRALIPGVMLVVWYRAGTRLVLAQAAGYARVGGRTLPIALTPRGRRLLSRRVPPVLDAVAYFVAAPPAGVPLGRPIRAAIRVTLRPR